MSFNQPVDAVITWVDGGDPLHQAKLSEYLEKNGLHGAEAAAPTRFNQCNELEYCVNSIIRYAPWIRTIYIVTDAQVPVFANHNALIQTSNAVSLHQHINRIKIIDHREIFTGFEGNLPTFNSLSIESMLWRISELSEKFIYFNDDCSLIRPVKLDDFFREDNLVLRGEWRQMSDRKLNVRLKKFLGFSNSPIDVHRQYQENSAKLAGFNKRFFHLPHAPLPLKKSTLENFFANHPQLLDHNSQFRLRNRSQFWPISLAHHLEIQQKTAVIDNSLQAITVNPAFHSLKKIKFRFKQADTNPRVAFVCMQSLDQASESMRAFMLEWLST